MDIETLKKYKQLQSQVATLADKPQFADNLKVAKEQVEQIEVAVCMLTAEEQDLVAYLFFERIPMRLLARKLNMGVATVCRKKTALKRRLEEIFAKMITK